MLPQIIVSTALLLHTCSANPVSRAAKTPCAVVDLGTSVHQATEDAGIYSFANIPYAEPPLGALRFRDPIAIRTVNRAVNDGSNPRICPQAGAPFFEQSFPLVLQTIADHFGGSFLGGGDAPAPPAGPTAEQSEDCLLLDVIVPKAVFGKKKVPVVVWIHGGGYIGGNKNESNAAGLVARSVTNGREGVVYVAINYRLGLFGFPPRSPDDLEVSSNAGLLDQALALAWVKKNIQHFGGDPSLITVIGESAGAGSIVAHLTSAGAANARASFQRAIIQSPAIKPATDAANYALLHAQFLDLAGVSNVDQARALTSEVLVGVNQAMIATAAFGSTHFGPNVDGKFLPQDPTLLLAAGRVPTDIPIITAHNLDEGLLFTDPGVQDQAGFKGYMSALMPTIAEAKIDRLVTEVYPEDFSGAQPYLNQTQRLALAISEGLINCQAVGTNLAYGNATRSYQFSKFPGIHAQDLSYTFFNGEETDTFGLPLPAEEALTVQDWVVDFTIDGYAGASVQQIPVYGAGGDVLDIGEEGFAVITDPSASSRCQFWLQELAA